MEELFWLGTAGQAFKMVGRYRQDKEMVKNKNSRSFLDLIFVHEILSCLVKGVYARDERQANPEKYWNDFGYEPINLNLGDEADRRKVAVPEAKYARLMIFERRGRGPNGGNGLLRVEDNERGGQHVVVRWPKYVVAIRGTIPTKRNDIIDDLRIAFETICKEVRLYKPIMHLLSAIHKEYGNDVWVAGHSLGATLGLIATRRLTIDEKIVLNGHFFNAPNLSLDVLAKKVVTSSMNGLADGAAKIPLIGEAARTCIRGTCSTAIGVAEGVTRSTGKFFFRRQFDAADRGFDKLRAQGYRPHLYVNPKDAICNEYIAHFHGSDPPAVSNAVPLTQVFIDSQSCHLIPLAYLHTNHWASGPHEAHKLHQWYLYDPENLSSELAG